MNVTVHKTNGTVLTLQHITEIHYKHLCGDGTRTTVAFESDIDSRGVDMKLKDIVEFEAVV